MIKVLHLDRNEARTSYRDLYLDLIDQPTGRAINAGLRRGWFELAADVDTGSLDAAFEATNHITGDWTGNDEVVATAGPHRSTSVGDIMVDAKGEMFFVAPIGFERVGRNVADLLKDGGDLVDAMAEEQNLIDAAAQGN